MTPEQFRDAISKGLGRVIQHLRSGASPEPYLDAIREACTVNLAYDVQCEDTRGQYLFDVLQASGLTAALVPDIARTLRITVNSREIWQGFDLCLLLAKAGYADARAAMYDRVGMIARPGDPMAGIGAIVELDGFEGLVRVLERIGGRILAGDEVDLKPYVLGGAQGSLGPDLRARLDETGAVNSAVRVCLESCDRLTAAEASRPARLSLLGKGYAQVNEELQGADGKLSFWVLREWARGASEEDLLAAARDLLTEDRPEFLLSRLRMFFDREFPLDLDHLCQIAETAEADLSHAAMNVLAAIENAAVRAFAVDLLRRGHRLENAFGLFELNYLSGDHLLIGDALESHEMDRETRHSAGLDLRKVFEDRQTPECRDVLMWVYENTPCSLCRGEVVETLAGASCLAEATAKECLDDSSLDTRAFAREWIAAGRA